MPGTEAGGTARRGRKLALRNWRVRSRLIALIAIPTMAAIVLGGLRTVTSLSSAAEYERVRGGAELTAEISELAHELEEERDLSARFVAQAAGAPPGRSWRSSTPPSTGRPMTSATASTSSSAADRPTTSVTAAEPSSHRSATGSTSSRACARPR